MFPRDMYYFWLHVGDKYSFLQATEIVLFHQCHLSLRLAFYAQEENLWEKLRLASMKCSCKTYWWVSFTPRKISCDHFFPYINHLEATGKSILTSRVQLWIWNWCGIQICCFKPSLSNSHINYEDNIFKASDTEIMHSYSDASSYLILGLQSQQFHWSQGTHLGCGMTWV